MPTLKTSVAGNEDGDWMEFDAYATRVAEIDGLYVQAGTLGRGHVVRAAGGLVTISLPGSGQPDRFERREWIEGREEDARTTWYEVASVDVRVDLAKQVCFSGTDEDFNGIEVVRSSSAKEAFSTVRASIDRALDRWKRTLRWIALAPEICFTDIRTRDDALRGGGFNLFRASDDRLFRRDGGSLVMPGGGKVTEAAWEAAGCALAADRPPPVWIDFLIEAHRRLRVGDLRSAIVNGAIASETAIRSLFSMTLPPIVSAVAVRILDVTPVQGLLSRWEEISGWDKAKARDNGKSQVHALFDLRNAVLHNGLNAAEDWAPIRTLLPRVTAFVLAADADASARLSSPTRPLPVDRATERLITAAT